MKTESEKTEFEKFDAALDQIMSVSHNELKLREAEWKKQKEAKRKARLKTSGKSRSK